VRSLEGRKKTRLPNKRVARNGEQELRDTPHSLRRFKPDQVPRVFLNPAPTAKRGYPWRLSSDIYAEGLGIATAIGGWGV